MTQEAFVTGAANGIGRATAVALSVKGYKVHLSDINTEELEKTKELILENGGQASTHKLDVSNLENVKEVFAQLKKEGKLSCFVNNAGIGGGTAPLHEITIDNMEQILSINLNGVMYCMQEELKLLLTQKKGGTIINIASLAGLKGMVLGGVYSASKHAVIGLTKTAALEYGKFGIRTNAVCPSFVETNILNGVPPKVLDFVKNYRNPLKRLGKPEEVANTITWLASEDSSYVNGQSIVIDGGMEAG